MSNSLDKVDKGNKIQSMSYFGRKKRRRADLPCGKECDWGLGVALRGHVHNEPSVWEDTKCFPSWCHDTDLNGSADCHRISAPFARMSHNTIWPLSNAINSCQEWRSEVKMWFCFTWFCLNSKWWHIWQAYSYRFMRFEWFFMKL